MPARTGAQSRAVDDRGRSSSSSDPGSAIEGFRQKIPLHYKLTDLGVKLGDLAIPALLSFAAVLVEHLGELFHRLALPGRNLGGVQFVLGRQLCHRIVAFDRFKGHLGFELSRKPSSRPHGGLVLCIGESTLAGCLRKWDHLYKPLPNGAVKLLLVCEHSDIKGKRASITLQRVR